MKGLYKRVIRSLLKNSSSRRGIFFTGGTAFILSFFLLTPPVLLPSETNKKVLILNSDVSIINYSLAHTGFQSKLPVPENVVDLGSKWVDEEKIKDAIHDINPSVIYCIGTRAYLLAYRFAGNKHLVFSSIINWRRLPMGKNTYGISNELPPSMQLTMYRYFFPEIHKIGILYSKDYNKEWIDIAVKSAKDVGITIMKRAINRQDEVTSVLEELLPKVDVLWLTPDPGVISNTELVEKIFQQSNDVRKPVFSYSEAFADLGATLIISADIPTIGMQAAGIALDLLSNKGSTERVQSPAGSHITINLRQVKKYKIKLNEEALDSVNQVIE